MELLRLVSLLLAINPVFQEVMDIVLGDCVDFSATKMCTKNGATLTHRLRDDSTRQVAYRDGLWRPGSDYGDRMSVNHSVILKITNMNDNGLFELTCGPGDETLIQLYVIPASKVSVTEGETVQLHYHHMSVGGTVRYIRCERNGKLVFEADLSSGVIRYGTGFGFRVSLPSKWRAEGDFSPTFARVHLEDQGDYFFYALDEGRGRTEEKPAAVRMKVTTKPEQITCPPPPACPTQTPAGERMETGTSVAITAVSVLCLVAVVYGFFRLLKSCQS